MTKLPGAIAARAARLILIFPLAAGACGGEAEEGAEDDGSGGSGQPGIASVCIATGWSEGATEGCSGGLRADVALLDDCCKEGRCFRDRATTFEIAVFAGGCPPDQQIETGDTSAAVVRDTVPTDGPPPSITPLSKKQYGFATLLRDEACRVLAYGCTMADLEYIRTVNVSSRAWTLYDSCTPLQTGGCGEGERCDQGVCAP